ncbi:MAG TPA: DUF2934 domain-containing protein [Blastocatellia bacterium]|jgi:hypothetical protein
MSKESIETLRLRLLGDPQVQTMIRMRAFELYQMRGHEPGHERDDWFKAEREVLDFLIHEENRRMSDARAGVVGQTGGPEGALGVWSATEPASAELAPAIGSEPEPALKAPEKKRKSSAKASTTRKAKSKDETGEGSKKSSSKSRAKKTEAKKE